MKIRYRSFTGGIVETFFKLPDFELRDGSEDCLNDYISDRMDQAGIKYKWFRIIK